MDPVPDQEQVDPPRLSLIGEQLFATGVGSNNGCVDKKKPSMAWLRQAVQSQSLLPVGEVSSRTSRQALVASIHKALRDKQEKKKSTTSADTSQRSAPLS